jgi:hypothetical protein
MTQYVDSTSAVDPGFINADTGAPAYDAAELRRLFGGLIRADNTADPLAVRPGALSAGSLVVSLDGSTIQVEPGPCVVGTVADGAYLTGLSAQNTALTLDAADLADPRKDRVSIQVLDDDIDAGGERKAQIVYESGVPGSGVYPDLPDNALSLAKIDVPVSGGGAAVVTDDRDRTGGAGSVLWVPTTTVRDTLTAYSSTDNPLVVYVKATGLFQISDDGAAWETLATREYADAAIDTAVAGVLKWLGSGSLAAGAGLATAPNWTTLATVAVTSAGGLCRAEAHLSLSNANSGAARVALFRVTCDGVAIPTVGATTTIQQDLPYIVGQVVAYNPSWAFESTPAAGAHTWLLQAQGANGYASAGKLTVMECQ